MHRAMWEPTQAARAHKVPALAPDHEGLSFHLLGTGLSGSWLPPTSVIMGMTIMGR